VSESRLSGPAFGAVLGELNRPGSRSLIPTPALVCDLDLLDENIARMTQVAASGGVALRPHVKSHKSAFVAQRQLEAGAVGLSFAKLTEAEAIVDRLTTDGYARRVSVLLTSPLAGSACATRAVVLAEKCDLMVVADHPDGVDELAAAFEPADAQLSVLCDVDVGLGRTGVVGREQALEVVERVEHGASLCFAGVQGYGGHLQHIRGREQRRAAAGESTRRLQEVIQALESRGIDAPLRTGGGTGTAAIDIEVGLLNELQPGSYVFMDREYRDALGDDPEGRFGQSLTISTTVISANQDGFVTVDAGLKAMATDAGSPLVVGHERDSQYHFFGDEQGLVTNWPGGRFLRGARLDLVPPHCDPTVDRYDFMWLVRGDVVLGVADVVARGCSQ
jgi:D-serine deaminase-like pyridoxal phosphate-dependent protein